MNYTCCTLCPRMCRVDRTRSAGYCGCTSTLKAARAALHQWEEPCISGVWPETQGSESLKGGSGTVFFSGCTLRCCFCQNHTISSGGFGKALTVRQLADIFLRLEDQGAFNINLVTPTQYLPDIIAALDLVRHKLSVPIVCNCGGYERVETLRYLEGYVDIYLPDLKYFDPALSLRYSHAEDYFQFAGPAVQEMIRQTGKPIWKEISGSQTSGPQSKGISQPLLARGTIIRHMVLPGCRKDSIRLLRWMKEHLEPDSFLISLLSQYTPFFSAAQYPEINRRITTYEYNSVVEAALDLGLSHGYMQEKSSAKEEYTPSFCLEGLVH